MNVDIDKIVKVYSGKSHHCMCGCQGKYSYTVTGAKHFHPGYDVTESVSERSVKIIAKKVLGNINAIQEHDYIYVDDGVRIRVVYFKKDADIEYLTQGVSNA